MHAVCIAPRAISVELLLPFHHIALATVFLDELAREIVETPREGLLGTTSRHGNYEYHKLSPEDQKTVRRWYWVNIVVMATLLTGLIALVSKFAGDEPGVTAQHWVTSTLWYVSRMLASCG